MGSEEKLSYYLSRDNIESAIGIETDIRCVSEPIGRHWHDFIEIELVTGGGGTQRINGKEMPLRRGSLTVMRPTDHHSVEPREALHLINISLDGRLLSEGFASGLIYGDIMFFDLSMEDTDGTERLLLLLHEECSRERADTRYMNNLVECLLLRILRKRAASAPAPHTASRISAAISYMQAHFKEGITLSSLAERLHYNPTHLSTLFHRELGVTFSDYLNTLRLSYARELLISTELKVFEVGIRCGFSSLSNFLRAFKAELGISPQKFREQGSSSR